MMRGTWTLIGVVAVLAGGLCGCQQPNMDEMMKQPPRPAELDRLDAFVGTWEGTWEMKMGGDMTKTGKGTDKFGWAADKWALTEQMEGTCDKNKMAGTGVWMWDPSAKQYRFGSTDNYGMIMKGTGRYDEKTQTWHMKGETFDTQHGHRSVGEGTLKMPNANTMEWHWTEWDPWHLIKYMEMNGTSHRK